MSPFLFRGNTMEHFNSLSPGEAERLAILLEEMGEAQQAIGKILRHGYKSRHPNGGPTNKNTLERELGDVRHAMNFLCENGDLLKSNIHEWSDLKAKKVKKYLHHNE